MDVMPTVKREPEDQSTSVPETSRDRLIFEEHYAGVAFMFDQMDKLVPPENSL